MYVSPRQLADKKGGSTTESERNNASLYGDPSDQPFTAAAFGADDGVANANQETERERDMPSNLMNSHSNVPGMTPAELLAEHRRSIAAIPGNEDREVDLHSLTLSRHQVEPADVYRAEMDGVPDDEFQECLNSFKFGEQNDEDGAHGGIHANS